jgi:hypothetical protein
MRARVATAYPRTCRERTGRTVAAPCAGPFISVIHSTNHFVWDDMPGMNASESSDLARKRPFGGEPPPEHGGHRGRRAVPGAPQRRRTDQRRSGGQRDRQRRGAAPLQRLPQASRSSPGRWGSPCSGRTVGRSNLRADAHRRRLYLRPGTSPGGWPSATRDPISSRSAPIRLTVRSTPLPRASKRDGARIERLRGGGLAVANSARPNSYFVAFPDSKALVEVYSPKPDRARELVRTTASCRSPRPSAARRARLRARGRPARGGSPRDRAVADDDVAFQQARQLSGRSPRDVLSSSRDR